MAPGDGRILCPVPRGYAARETASTAGHGRRATGELVESAKAPFRAEAVELLFGP